MNTCKPLQKQSLKNRLDNNYYSGIDLLPNCPAILTQEEVACICSVSLPTIQRMVQAKILPVNCDGDILKQDLIEYIKTHTLADKPVI